jgi:hypothetical protein
VVNLAQDNDAAAARTLYLLFALVAAAGVFASYRIVRARN